MRFTKMHGAGNDYIYVDCFAQPVPQRYSGAGAANFGPPVRRRRRWADLDLPLGAGRCRDADVQRRRLVLRRCAATASAASPSTCTTTAFAAATRSKIESAGRVLSLDLQHANGLVDHVRVDMGEPILIPAQIPTTLRSASGPEQPVVDVPLAVGGREFRVTCVSMGNPHCVVFVDEATDDWVLGIGPKMEVDPHFPKRVNVEFVEVLSRDGAAAANLGTRLGRNVRLRHRRVCRVRGGRAHGPHGSASDDSLARRRPVDRME